MRLAFIFAALFVSDLFFVFILTRNASQKSSSKTNYVSSKITTATETSNIFTFWLLSFSKYFEFPLKFELGFDALRN